MKRHLLPESGNFYKANLHCHTTVSDGKKTPEEVKEIYKSFGYSVVAYTDHDVFVPHYGELTDDSFLALNGFEIEVNEDKEGDSKAKKCCHICFIAIEPDKVKHPLWHRSRYVWGNAQNYMSTVMHDDSAPDYVRSFSGDGVSDMMKRGRDNGFFVTYNHPTWSMEDFSDYINYEGMHAFEMFNGGCLVAGYDDYNPRVYDDILRSGKKIFAIGADDNHNGHPVGSRRCDSGVAFTVIKAPSLEYRDITKALEDGHFYASEGPEIFELTYGEGTAYIKCSDADRIYCTYGVRKAAVAYPEESETVTEASFNIPEDCVYFRITVVDKSGRHATTNAYFIEDLK